MARIFLMLLLILSFYGCATAPNFNGISLGMSKADVIKTLGSPSSVSAKGNTEYLKYELSPGLRTGDVNPPEYFVRLINGKVESYGKVGDFDSTKDQVNVIKLQTQKQ